MPDLHADFVAALDGATAKVLRHLRQVPGVDASARFAVHARNRRQALTDALASSYPVVARIVGDEFFRALAAGFLQRHPPRSAALLLYGAEFPRFLAEFPPAQAVACLGDVARLERAWAEAMHAAECTPLTLRALATLPAEQLVDARFSLHPSLRLVPSAHPIVSLWNAHREERTRSPLASSGPETALLIRPVAQVAVHGLDAGDGAFIAALARGRTLGEAADGPDAAAQLAALFNRGAVTAVIHPGEQT